MNVNIVTVITDITNTSSQSGWSSSILSKGLCKYMKNTSRFQKVWPSLRALFLSSLPENNSGFVWFLTLLTCMSLCLFVVFLFFFNCFEVHFKMHQRGSNGELSLLTIQFWFPRHVSIDQTFISRILHSLSAFCLCLEKYKV